MTLEPGTAVIVGNVHDIDDRHTVVVVDLTLAEHYTARVYISHPNGRQAARRWNEGDRITAWGRLLTITEPTIPHHVELYATRTHRWRPGHIPHPADPTRRIPPWTIPPEMEPRPR